MNLPFVVSGRHGEALLCRYNGFATLMWVATDRTVGWDMCRWTKTGRMTFWTLDEDTTPEHSDCWVSVPEKDFPPELMGLFYLIGPSDGDGTQ